MHTGVKQMLTLNDKRLFDDMLKAQCAIAKQMERIADQLESDSKHRTIDTTGILDAIYEVASQVRDR